jgi:fucose 4-O-acetylase-like acetyltransferase
MLLVIIDHCGISLCPAVDCLEVPAFFIASGFLFRSNVDFKDLIMKKMRRLIVPYVVYAIAYILIFRPSSSVLYDLILPANEPLWFLKTLAWIFLLAYALNHISFRRLLGCNNQKVDICICIFVTLVCSYIASQHRVQLLTLVGLQQAIIALPLFYAGSILNKSRLLRMPWIFVCLVLWLVTARYNIHMHDSDVGANFFLFVVSAIAGFCAIYGVFDYIKKFPLMEFMGARSLEILGVHLILIHLISPVLPNKYLLFPVIVALSLAYAWLYSLAKTYLSRTPSK